MSRSTFAFAALYVCSSLALVSSVSAANVNIGGSDNTGYLSLSNVKNWGSEAAVLASDGGPNYAYYKDPVSGLYKSIAAGPLSASSTYAEEATYTVVNKTVTDPNFSSISSGSINYDNSGLTGIGTETINAAALTFSFNNAAFSPLGSAYNTGSGFGNFGWDYVIAAASPTGTGLTFTDGQLTSIDLTATIDVKVRFGGLDAATFNVAGPSTAIAFYTGSLTISGNQFAFNLDVTQTVDSFLGTLTDTRMVFNRAGTIDGVTLAAVPEPSSVLLLGVGLLGLVAGRRRLRVKQ